MLNDLCAYYKTHQKIMIVFADISGNINVLSVKIFIERGGLMNTKPK